MKKNYLRKHKQNKNLQFKKRTLNLAGLSVPYFILVVGVVISALTVYMTIQTVTVSAKLAYLENEEYQLLKRNEELNNSLIENSSLSALAKNADSLGFIKPLRFIYSEKDNEVAKLP